MDGPGGMRRDAIEIGNESPDFGGCAERGQAGVHGNEHARLRTPHSVSPFNTPV